MTRRPDDPEAPLTDEEIAAILEQEGGMSPEAGHAAAPVHMVQTEPGKGRFGAWMVWIVVAFILAGALLAAR